MDLGKSLSPRRGGGAGWARFGCCPGARAAPRRARLSPARAPSRSAASPSGDRLFPRGRRALLPRGASGLHPDPRLGTPASGRIPARSGSGVRSEEPRESGSERGSRGGECARVWRSERARECACLTRGEVCKGRIPSFLPQPLVETRRMQRPPGRSAAPRRAAGGRRAGPRSQPGSPAPAPTAPLPRPRGPEAPSPRSPAAGKPPGGVLLLLPAWICAKGAPPGGEQAPSLPGGSAAPRHPWQTRPCPHHSRGQISLHLTLLPPAHYESPASKEGGASEGRGGLLKWPPLAGCPERPHAQTEASETITVH